MHDLILAWVKNLILERKAAWTIALQQLSTEREYQKIFLETFVSERKKTEKKNLSNWRVTEYKTVYDFFQSSNLTSYFISIYISQVNNNL